MKERLFFWCLFSKKLSAEKEMCFVQKCSTLYPLLEKEMR